MKHKWYTEIIAWANGMQIQFTLDGQGIRKVNWLDIRAGLMPSWDDDCIRFRVKPEPLTAYVNTTVVGNAECAHSVHPSIRGAEIAADPLRSIPIVINRIAVKMIEVEDE